jgi:RND family efflux transporter MFP subunit
VNPGRRRSFIVIVAGVVVTLALVVGFVVLHRQPRTVSELTLHAAAFTIGLPESGVIQYPQVQTVSSQIAGNIGHIYVASGERVAAGQLLATIVNPQIVSGAQSSAAAFRAASARAQSAEVTDTTNVAQAQANLEAARARLAQAREDEAAGLQSGPGYPEATAALQRAQAEGNAATAATDLREARRLYLAYRDLYANKAVSRDDLDRAQAKYEEAQVAYRQAQVRLGSVDVQLSRSRAVLSDNLRSAEDGFAQAQAALAAARVESSSGDVAAASAEAAQAGSEYAFAREQANATEVRAPYDATVLSVATEKNDALRPLQPGDAIDVGQPLVTLTSKPAFVVRTRVDEQDVIDVHAGQRVLITGEDFPGRVLSGHVVEVSPLAQAAADSTSAPRTVATTIAVDRAPAFLRDGMSVDINILTTDIRSAIVVPNDALVRDGTAAYVYLVRGGRAYRQPVRLGLSNETSSVIVYGLHAGDVIVTETVTGLDDGTAVAPESAESRS